MFVPHGWFAVAVIAMPILIVWLFLELVLFLVQREHKMFFRVWEWVSRVLMNLL